MKKTEKGFSSLLILGAIVVVVVLGGLFIYTKMKSETGIMTPSTASVNEQIPPIMATPTPANMKAGNSSLTNGNSNADLDQDLQTIGKKMSAVDNANAAVDASINNQSSDSVTNLQ